MFKFPYYLISNAGFDDNSYPPQYIIDFKANLLMKLGDSHGQMEKRKDVRTRDQHRICCHASRNKRDENKISPVSQNNIDSFPLKNSRIVSFTWVVIKNINIIT